MGIILLYHCGAIKMNCSNRDRCYDLVIMRESCMATWFLSDIRFKEIPPLSSTISPKSELAILSIMCYCSCHYSIVAPTVSLPLRGYVASVLAILMSLCCYRLL